MTHDEHAIRQRPKASETLRTGSHYIIRKKAGALFPLGMKRRWYRPRTQSLKDDVCEARPPCKLGRNSFPVRGTDPSDQPVPQFGAIQ